MRQLHRNQTGPIGIGQHDLCLPARTGPQGRSDRGVADAMGGEAGGAGNLAQVARLQPDKDQLSDQMRPVDIGDLDPAIPVWLYLNRCKLFPQHF